MAHKVECSRCNLVYRNLPGLTEKCYQCSKEGLCLLCTDFKTCKDCQVGLGKPTRDWLILQMYEFDRKEYKAQQYSNPKN